MSSLELSSFTLGTASGSQELVEVSSEHQGIAHLIRLRLQPNKLNGIFVILVTSVCVCECVH